jgi:type IV pilus assembly protein PilN
MIKVNLLPYREEKAKLDTLGYFLISSAMFIFTLLILFSLWIRQNHQISLLEAKKTAMLTNLKIFEKIRKEAKKYGEEVKILENKIQAIDVLRRKKGGPVLLLDQLSRRIADDIWLNSLVQQDSKFIIQGSSLTNEGIATFMKNLSESEYFHEVELVQSIKTTSFGEEIYNFTLIFKWSRPSTP